MIHIACDHPVSFTIQCLGEAVLYHGGRCLTFPEGTKVYEIKAPGYCLVHVYAHPSEDITVKLVPNKDESRLL